MSLLGVRLTLLIGPTVAVPAPPPLIEALHEVEVTHRDDGQSGFSISFNIGRAGPAALMDYALAASPLLRSRFAAGRAPEDLRALLREAAEALRANPRDERLYRAVHRTYLEPLATQELAAERLGLPFSTYRAHLAAGIDRIAAWLWRRGMAQS